MFETQKIDTFFSGEHNLLDEEESNYTSRRTKVVRFLKLFLPSLTALLLGLGVVLFDFEANNDSSVPLADEEKIYFEKFRMKNTVFEITEKDNQFTSLKAKTVEEIQPNSKIYDLVEPFAQTFDKGKVLSLQAQQGSYNQNNKTLNLNNKVTAFYDQSIKVETSSASYNFSDETGFGNEKIVGHGEKEYFEADKFTFDKKNGVISLLGHVYLKNDGLELRSPDSATLFSNENKLSSVNAYILKDKKDSLKGDKIVAFFKDMKKFEIVRAECIGHTELQSGKKQAFGDRGEYDASTGKAVLYGNVKIIDEAGYTATGDEGHYDVNNKTFTLKKNVTIKNKNGYTATALIGEYDLDKKTFTLKDNVRIEKGKNVITAPRAVYFQNKEEFRFYQDVTVTQEDSSAKAGSGVYYVKKNIAELEGHVVIVKNGNEVRGDKAISDFTTSQSRIIAKSGRRIFGKLIESTLKKDSKDK